MKGSITSRVLTSGKVRYDVRFRDRDGEQVTKTFVTEAEAEAFTAATVDAVATGTYQRLTPVLLSVMFAKWLDAIKTHVLLGRLRKSTRAGYASAMTGHLIPAFGHLRSDEITTQHVSDWQTACAAKIKAGTLAAKYFNNQCGALSAALNWGRVHRYLAHHPLPPKLRSSKKGGSRVIVEGEVDLSNLWHEAEGADRVIVALALFAGLRRGEIFGARWVDVCWPTEASAATLRVTQAFVQREIVEPKTAAGARAVELPAPVVKLLREYQKARPPLKGPDGCAYLIRQDTGAPVDPDNWATKVWPGIRDAAGLPPTVTMHGLRHTFASLHLADGADVKHVSEQLGHTSVAFTMQTYQHVLQRRKHSATEALARHIPTGKRAKKAKGLRLVKRA